MLLKLLKAVRSFGSGLLLWMLLWSGALMQAGQAAPQGDAPTNLIYENAASEAVRQDDAELVEAFRKRQVEVKKKANASGAVNTKVYAEAMIRAGGQGDLELVKLLLERGADIAHRSSGNSKSTVLQAAVGNCRTELVAFLFERGASLNERSSGMGAPLLHTAAGVGCIELVQWLLARGADIKAQNAFGDTVLYAAVGHSNQDVKVLELLLARGADPRKQNNRGYTPLMQAATAPRTIEDEQLAINFIKLLLEHGANLNTQTFDYGDTALIWAVKLGHARVAEFLLARGADFKLKDKEGRDALRHAQERKHKEIELLLLRAGAA